MFLLITFINTSCRNYGAPKSDPRNPKTSKTAVYAYLHIVAPKRKFRQRHDVEDGKLRLESARFVARLPTVCPAAHA